MTDVASFTARAMGSPLRLQLSAAAGPRTRRAWAAVQAEFADVDAELSCYRPDSALSRLNQRAGSGRWLSATPRLDQFLAVAARATRRSNGRFDPRVLVDLHRLGHPGLIVPLAGGNTSTPRSPSGPAGDRPSSWLERDGRTRRVRIRTAVDSGGLGKGLALRWAARRIAGLIGGQGALLEAGGDIAAWGSAPGGGPWQVGIEDPAGGETPLAVVTLTSGAISTSSIARRSWIGPDGRPAHHLLDPRTGAPGGEGLRAVTVAGPDPAWAEVWTKMLFLAGPVKIGDEARSLGLAAWWVEADGSFRMTPAARLRTVWTSE